MAIYPKTVYTIFPFNCDGSVAGVYVGSTHCVSERIDRHIHDHKSRHMKEFHELMRRNGFDLKELDFINSYLENHIEYDWIDFFKRRTDLQVFNYRQNLCGANWCRLKVMP